MSSSRRVRLALVSSLTALSLTATALVHGAPPAPPTKDECIAAHSTGQDQRAQGHLAQAKQTFLTCAQASCPAIVQSDCARFADDVGRLLPSVSFAVRDPKRGDLSAADVYVDGLLLTSRLDDGRTYELDPGKHTVRVVEGGREVTLPVVLVEGERGRAVIVKFPGDPKDAAPPSSESTKSRPTLPLWIAGIGGLMLVSGVVVGVVGLGKVPGTCSLSDHTCSAPPGGSDLDAAKSGVTLADVGLGLGIGGLALLGSGLTWYFASSPRAEAPRATASSITPWLARDGGGISFGATF
jgi:hypothetical protein